MEQEQEDLYFKMDEAIRKPLVVILWIVAMFMGFVAILFLIGMAQGVNQWV